jgi:hypothetical protein
MFLLNSIYINTGNEGDKAIMNTGEYFPQTGIWSFQDYRKRWLTAVEF